MAPLWTYYVGSNVNPRTSSVYGPGLAAQRRRKLLNLALRIGTIKPEQVSSSDRSLLDMRTGGPSKGGGGFLNSIGSVLGDVGRTVGNLGSDLGDMAIHLPGGLYTMGKSVVDDITHPSPVGSTGFNPDPLTRNQSQIQKNIIDPTVEGLKSDAVTLKELVTGHPERFIQHPLNPLLTVGAAFSGGATALGRGGGAIARAEAMAGREGALAQVGRRMAQITSPEGRSPTLSQFTRRYSTSPTFKLGQMASDKFVDSRVGNRLNLPILQDRRAMRRFLDQTFGEARQAIEHRTSLVNKPLAQSLTRMSPEERVATYYSLRGVNSPDLVVAYVERLRQSLERTQEAGLGNTVEGDYIGRFARDLVSPDAARVQLQNLSNPQVLNFIENPTQQMRDFGVMWDDYIRSRHPELGIDPEQHIEHIGSLQRELNPDLEELSTPEGGIRPSYVPDMAARDMAFQEPGRFNLIRRGPFARNEKMAGVFQGPIRSPEPLRNPVAPYLKGSSLETVLTGAQRTDPRLFLDHVRRIEDDLIMREFNVGTVEHLGFKGDSGATMSFRSTDEMNRALVERMGNARASPIATPDEWKQWDPRNWVLVTPDLPIRWYREGHNSVEGVLRGLEEQGIDVNAVTKEDLERLLESGARGFWESVLGATRTPGVAIPRTAFRRVVDNIEASRPYMPGLAQYARLLNTWRTLTLAYMPRWLVNTAVGSTMMAMAKGLFNPRHYRQGMRLAREDSLPASVRLGGVVHGEALEAGSRLGRVHFPVTRGIFKMVQSVEDFFRQASFVQSLEKGAKQKMAEQGVILDKYRPFWNRDRNEFIDNLIRTEPDLVRNAIDDVDRFAYNFTSLSPFERRYIRLLIPFWGWYKFITKFAYRLPTEYPGRTRIIAAISDIGERIENEQGPIPPWIKGSIILGRRDGVLSYIPTLGLNPISQFANPFSDEGAVSGLLRLGQLSPPIQAGLSGMGINTMDASQQAISPVEGVANDWTGGLVDTQTGEPVELQGRASGRRVLRSLLTSVPQIRLADLAANEGRPAYPDSIPILEHRTMPVQDISRRDVSPLGILNQFVGAQPRKYNVRKYQKNLRKRAKYARSVAKRQLKAGR